MSEIYWDSKTLSRNLKEAAFKSHSKAYVSGGLTILALISHNFMFNIGNIPRSEFSPLAHNFKASVKQVFDTVEKVIPEAAGVTLTTLAGPGHTRSLQHAHRKDMNAVWGHKQVLDSLNRLKGDIQRRKLDAPPILNEIIKRLNARKFRDMGTARLAREVIQAAEDRKRTLSNKYRLEVTKDPSLRLFYNQCLIGWER